MSEKWRIVKNWTIKILITQDEVNDFEPLFSKKGTMNQGIKKKKKTFNSSASSSTHTTNGLQKILSLSFKYYHLHLKKSRKSVWFEMKRPSDRPAVFFHLPNVVIMNAVVDRERGEKKLKPWNKKRSFAKLACDDKWLRWKENALVFDLRARCVV